MLNNSIRRTSFLVPIILVSIGGAALCRSSSSKGVPEFKEKWRVTNQMDAPECAYLDSESGNIYVSLNPGQQDRKDGKGRVAKLRRDGKMINPNWAVGLNAPKGMRRFGDTLWVADINEIVGINVTTGRLTSRRSVQDAKALSGVAVADDGTVYVSDFRGAKIYALSNGTVSVFVDDPVYDPPKIIMSAAGNVAGTMIQDPIGRAPKGIFVDGVSLVAGGGGQPDGHVSGTLYTLNLKTKERTVLYPWPFANIDSIESDGKGGYIFGDGLAGDILRFPAHGLKPERLQQLKPGTGQIRFIPSENLLLVPFTRGNMIVAYDISDALAYSDLQRRR